MEMIEQKKNENSWNKTN